MFPGVRRACALMCTIAPDMDTIVRKGRVLHCNSFCGRCSQRHTAEGDQPEKDKDKISPVRALVRSFVCLKTKLGLWGVVGARSWCLCLTTTRPSSTEGAYVNL